LRDLVLRSWSLEVADAVGDEFAIDERPSSRLYANGDPDENETEEAEGRDPAALAALSRTRSGGGDVEGGDTSLSILPASSITR
jgi:hypothetical protein